VLAPLLFFVFMKRLLLRSLHDYHIDPLLAARMDMLSWDSSYDVWSIFLLPSTIQRSYRIVFNPQCGSRENTSHLNLTLIFEIPPEAYSEKAFRIKLDERNRFAVLRGVEVESTMLFYGDCNKGLPFS
jgi:hypothetical protein